MDLNNPLRRNQLSPVVADRSLSPREKRAHAQFAREISDQIGRTREALGPDHFAKTGPALPGSVT